MRGDNGEWISKQDVGVESNTEKEKGQASDAFKRACVNWGIGRELYTAPFIWINLAANEWDKSRGVSKPKVKFEVESIKYEGKVIKYLKIVEKNTRIVRYEYSNGRATVAKAPVVTMSKEMEDALTDALESIKQARSRKELASIYNELKAFQNNQRFVDALAERQKELKAEGITN